MDGGQEGLERGLEHTLSGQIGALHFYRDAARRLIALDGDVLAASAHPPRDGCSVLLTIDARLQQAAEEQLAQIHSEYDPKAATCIVMDPLGAIPRVLARHRRADRADLQLPAEARRCRPFTDLRSPAHVQTFFASEALEHRRWRRDEVIFGEMARGVCRSARFTTRTPMDFCPSSKSSPNPATSGIAKICQRFTLREMYDSVRDFGFGEQTGANFPVSPKGMVRAQGEMDQRQPLLRGDGPRNRRDASCSSSPRIARSINGGTLYRPKLVQRVTDENGKTSYELRAQP
jgi:cell division protein FtsI/penicillin-binding protein 2